MKRLRPWLRHLPLVALALATLLAAIFLRGVIDFEVLREHRAALLAFRDAYYVSTMVAFVVGYITIILLSLPAAAMASMLGGFLFGLFPGVLLNVGAAATGAIMIFTALRLGLGDGLRRRIDATDGRIGRFADALRANEVPVLIAMRLVPILPFFMVNLLAALFGVATLRFAWTTVLGIIPGGFVYTWVGAGLGEVFARGETPNMGIIFEPHILGPILGLAALALLPIFLRPYLRA